MTRKGVQIDVGATIASPEASEGHRHVDRLVAGLLPAPDACADYSPVEPPANRGPRDQRERQDPGENRATSNRGGRLYQREGQEQYGRGNDHGPFEFGNRRLPLCASLLKLCDHLPYGVSEARLVASHLFRNIQHQRFKLVELACMHNLYRLLKLKSPLTSRSRAVFDQRPFGALQIEQHERAQKSGQTRKRLRNGACKVIAGVGSHDHRTSMNAWSPTVESSSASLISPST